MTPQQLANYARQQYNSTGDEFFSDAELLTHVFDAEMRLALEAKCIRRVFTTPSVANQQEYTTPTTFLGLFRATFDGKKMDVVTVDDVLNLTEGTLSGSLGSPTVCATWADTLYVGPIPSEVKTIKLWGFTAPSAPTVTSALSVPDRHQFKIVNYLLARKAAKDNNNQLLMFYDSKWEKDVEKAVSEERILQRTGGLATVRNEDWEHGVE